MLLISTICNNIYVLFTLSYKVVVYYYLGCYLFPACGDFYFFALLFFRNSRPAILRGVDLYLVRCI
jgi:hypothetical protein